MKKIYAFISLVGLVLFAGWNAFRAGQLSKANQIKAEAEEAAREYQNAGSEALIGGLDKELKVRNEKHNDTADNHFR